MQAYTSVPSQGKSRRNPKSHIEVVRERGGCHLEHTALLHSLFPSLLLTSTLLEWWLEDQDSSLLSHPVLPFPWSLHASQHPHPGTSPPTPRGLIKSFFLTNYVVSLRGILRNQIPISQLGRGFLPWGILIAPTSTPRRLHLGPRVCPVMSESAAALHTA